MKAPLAQPDDFAESQRGSVGSADLPHPVPSERADEGSRPTFLAPYLPADTATWINWLLRLVVGGAFVFAGALKIVDPAKFAIAVGHYRLLPDELINLVAVLLPGMEVVAGLFVLAGVWLEAAALVVTSLTVIFAVVIGSALARGLNIDCGCFGTMGGKHIGLANLAIDMALFCLAASLAWRAGFRPGQLKFSAKPGRKNLPPRRRLH